MPVAEAFIPIVMFLILGIVVMSYFYWSHKSRQRVMPDPIARLFTGLPLIGIVQAVLVAVAAAFYAWMMDEDFTLKT